MNDRPMFCRPLASALIIALITAAMPAVAQEVVEPIAHAKPATWRPKDGIYAYLGKDFEIRCRDFGELTIAFARRTIMGNEVSCKITNLTSVTPATLKLDLLCLDYNLAAHLKEPDEREFKEVMLLKKINEATLSVQKTINGEFTDPSAQAIYCPNQTQRNYVEVLRRDREAKRAETAAKRASERWIPKDGIYAPSGSDFDDRCSKFDGLALGVSDGSLSIGENRCSIFGRSDWRPNEISLEMICNGRTGAHHLNLRKMSDRKILVQSRSALMSMNEPVERCSEDIQRAYRERQAGK